MSDVNVPWTAIPEVEVRYNVRATGRPDVGWHAYCLSFLDPDRRDRARMLAIGAGSGWLGRDLSRRRAFARFDVVDESEETIERSREIDASEGHRGIAYVRADPGTIELPERTYDAIWTEMALSHVDALEHLVAQLARSLRPEGYLFAHEYVGPNGYAFGRRQRDVLQAAFALIPPRFRRPGGRTDAEPLGRLELPDAPAEGERSPRRSADVVPLIRAHFDVVEERAIGGTLYPLLADIGANFSPDDKTSVSVLEMLLRVEDALIDSGDLASDLALVIARSKARTA